MFYSLIKYMNTSSHILNYHKNALAEFITHNDFSSNIKVYSSEIECNCDLLADIRSAKNEIKLLIPRGRLNPEYGKRIMDEIHKQKLNKKVIVYDKSVVVPMEYENSCIPSDKITMPILLIDNKAWYGLPIYRHDSTDGQVSYPIYTDIIVRFTGKHTVEMIRSLVEHANVKPPVMTNLALYVKNNCHCIQCGQALTLVKANKHFLRCNDCNKTQVLTKEMVDRYLDSTGGKCSRCGRDMFAVNGQYGLYVRCSENHTYKLDEI